MKTRIGFIAAVVALAALVSSGCAAFSIGLGVTKQLTPSQKAFSTVARVMRHPRCLNCHTVTDFPRVGDDRRRHRMNVRRGPKDHGVPGMRCSACHQARNQDEAGVPGAPHWALAPLSMGWEGLDDHALAKSLLDRAKNGDRSLADLVRHMAEDPLVGWAWAPGKGRRAPAVSRKELVDAMKEWVAGGADVPPPGITSY